MTLPDRKLTLEEMRAWLDRKPPQGSNWRDFIEPEPSDFDKAREAEPLMEAGHG